MLKQLVPMVTGTEDVSTGSASQRMLNSACLVDKSVAEWNSMSADVSASSPRFMLKPVPDVAVFSLPIAVSISVLASLPSMTDAVTVWAWIRPDSFSSYQNVLSDHARRGNIAC